VRVYFLGASVPQGVQTVVVNRTNNAVTCWAYCITVRGSRDTEVYSGGAVLLQGDGTMAEQAVSDERSARSQRYAAGFYGDASANVTAGANTNELRNHNFAGSGGRLMTELVPGNGSRNIGFVSANADDRAITHFAVELVEAVGGARSFAVVIA
jgi:hypothetical protein